MDANAPARADDSLIADELGRLDKLISQAGDEVRMAMGSGRIEMCVKAYAMLSSQRLTLLSYRDLGRAQRQLDSGFALLSSAAAAKAAKGTP